MSSRSQGCVGTHATAGTATAPSRLRAGDLERRLARVEGQVRGLTRMVMEGRPCAEILQQIKAAQGALDRVALALIEGYIGEPATWAQDGSREERIAKLLAATERLTSHR